MKQSFKIFLDNRILSIPADHFILQENNVIRTDGKVSEAVWLKLN